MRRFVDERLGQGRLNAQARALGAVGVLPKQIKPVEVGEVLRSQRIARDVRRIYELGFFRDVQVVSEDVPGGKRVFSARSGQDKAIAEAETTPEATRPRCSGCGQYSGL